MSTINGWGMAPAQLQAAEDRRNVAVQKVQQVKKGWIPFSSDRDPCAELARFEKGKPAIYKAVTDQFGCAFDTSNVCYMRAIEIIEALGETHYCFMHGQSFEEYVRMLFNTKVIEAKDPSLAGKYRKFFRKPEDVADSPKNVKEFIEKNPEIHDSKLGKEILSVSGYPISRVGYESAFFFFCNRFSFNPTSSRAYLGHIKIGISPKLGALHLIAVPKECAEEGERCGVYNSKPGGCPTGASTDLLKRFQKLENVQGASDQYRLLASMLTFNPEVLTVTLSEMTKVEKKGCYDEVLKVVKEGVWD